MTNKCLPNPASSVEAIVELLHELENKKDPKEIGKRDLLIQAFEIAADNENWEKFIKKKRTELEEILGGNPFLIQDSKI